MIFTFYARQTRKMYEQAKDMSSWFRTKFRTNVKRFPQADLAARARTHPVHASVQRYFRDIKIHIFDCGCFLTMLLYSYQETIRIHTLDKSCIHAAICSVSRDCIRWWHGGTSSFMIYSITCHSLTYQSHNLQTTLEISFIEFLQKRIL